MSLICLLVICLFCFGCLVAICLAVWLAGCMATCLLPCCPKCLACHACPCACPACLPAHPPATRTHGALRAILGIALLARKLRPQRREQAQQNHAWASEAMSRREAPETQEKHRKHTPAEKKTHGRISLTNTSSSWVPAASAGPLPRRRSWASREVENTRLNYTRVLQG